MQNSQLPKVHLAAASSQTVAPRCGTQTSLLAVSSCMTRSCRGVPTLTVAKYPPLPFSFVMTSSNVEFPERRCSPWRRWRLSMSHWTTRACDGNASVHAQNAAAGVHSRMVITATAAKHCSARACACQSLALFEFLALKKDESRCGPYGSARVSTGTRRPKRAEGRRDRNKIETSTTDKG